MKRAEEAGAKILKPAEDKSWGGYSGYFADPDGFLCEVAWNPGWRLAANGSVTLRRSNKFRESIEDFKTIFGS